MRLQPTAFAGAGNVLATRLFATLSDDEMRREMDNINDAVRARRMRMCLVACPPSPQQPPTPHLACPLPGITVQFVEARDEIEFANESKDTTYFNEEAEVAKEAVQGNPEALGPSPLC
jgi:hypothetical protein